MVNQNQKREIQYGVGGWGVAVEDTDKPISTAIELQERTNNFIPRCESDAFCERPLGNYGTGCLKGALDVGNKLLGLDRENC